jgi:hypothetical protein
LAQETCTHVAFLRAVLKTSSVANAINFLPCKEAVYYRSLAQTGLHGTWNSMHSLKLSDARLHARSAAFDRITVIAFLFELDEKFVHFKQLFHTGWLNCVGVLSATQLDDV